MANRAAGQLIRVEEPDSGGNLTETARYAYDAMGRMLTVQMGRKSDGTFKQTRTFVYNTAGQLTSSTTPEKGLVSYTYRTDGLVETKTEPAGTKQSPTTKTLMYNYDDKHRLTNVYRVNSPNNLTVLTAFAYDTDLWGFGGANTQGRMVLAMNWDPNKTYAWFFSYDVMGRVNKQSLQTPYLSNGNYLVAQATYGYDDDGNLTAIGYPGNLAPLASATQALNCTHAYDVIGRPTSYQCTDTNQITTTLANNATYNASGQLLSWQEGSSTLTRGYDVQRGWLTSLTAGAALNLGYAYYGNGQAKSVSDTVNGGQAVTSYTYDNLNRLYSAATPNWTLTYGYDEFGNRTSQHGTGSATSVEQTAVYDTAYTNQIVSSTTNGVGASYVYDAAGNMTSNGSQTIAYDSFNRPVTIGSAAMIYDGFGRRVEKTVNGQTYIYFYDARGRQIQTYVLSSGAAANVLHSFAGQRIGQWTDRVGSKRSDGSTISHYYPYGEELPGRRMTPISTRKPIGMGTAASITL